MSEQSLLKIVKRWRRYESRGDWSGIPPKTHGFYVLYKKRQKEAKEKFDVVYIGVAGLGKRVRRGIRGRLKRHDNRKEGWTHYSFFEVHDNVTPEYDCRIFKRAHASSTTSGNGGCGQPMRDRPSNGNRSHARLRSPPAQR
jgi:hypothetical protein